MRVCMCRGVTGVRVRTCEMQLWGLGIRYIAVAVVVTHPEQTRQRSVWEVDTPILKSPDELLLINGPRAIKIDSLESLQDGDGVASHALWVILGRADRRQRGCGERPGGGSGA